MSRPWAAKQSPPRAGPAPRRCVSPPVRPGGPFEVSKRFMKRYGRTYAFLRLTFSPLHRCRGFRRELSQALAANPPGRVVLNLGCGPHRPAGRRDIVNLDAEAFREVDVVADVQALPFRDSCADLVLNLDLLEHVPDPRLLVGETWRVLRPGGRTLAFIPFLYPVHPAPADYCRFTPQGLELLFQDFSACRVGVASGPTSAVLLALRDWAATAGSLGFRPLYDLVYALFSVATFPLKYLDEGLVCLPTAGLAAGAFYVAACK